MIGDTTKCRITQFGTLMLRELGKNQEKGNWESWKPDEGELVKELYHHLGKLEKAIFLRDPVAVAEHSADLANFCMKSWELYVL